MYSDYLTTHAVFTCSCMGRARLAARGLPRYSMTGAMSRVVEIWVDATEG